MKDERKTQQLFEWTQETSDRVILAIQFPMYLELEESGQTRRVCRSLVWSVLRAIVDEAKRDGWCSLSLRELVERAHLRSKTQVSRALAILDRLGLVIFSGRKIRPNWDALCESEFCVLSESTKQELYGELRELAARRVVPAEADVKPGVVHPELEVVPPTGETTADNGGAAFRLRRTARPLSPGSSARGQLSPGASPGMSPGACQLSPVGGQLSPGLSPGAKLSPGLSPSARASTQVFSSVQSSQTEFMNSLNSGFQVVSEMDFSFEFQDAVRELAVRIPGQKQPGDWEFAAKLATLALRGVIAENWLYTAMESFERARAKRGAHSVHFGYFVALIRNQVRAAGMEIGDLMRRVILPEELRVQ